MYQIRRFTCWLLFAALLIGGIAGTSAFARHLGTSQDSLCGQDVAAMQMHGEHADAHASDCATPEEPCTEWHCLQVQVTLPSTLGELASGSLAPVATAATRDISLLPAFIYRPPRA